MSLSFKIKIIKFNLELITILMKYCFCRHKSKIKDIKKAQTPLELRRNVEKR